MTVSGYNIVRLEVLSNPAWNKQNRYTLISFSFRYRIIAVSAPGMTPENSF